MNKRLKVMMLGWRDQDLPMLKQMADRNIEIVYLGWSGDFDEVIWNQLKILFPNIIIHLYSDITRHRPAPELNRTEFQPPGKQLLRTLGACESEVMTMITRLDYSQYLPLHHRKRLYYEMVRYWDGVIHMIRPDCIAYSFIPHGGGSDYVLYRLAKLYQIRQFFSVFTSIGARSLLFDSRETGCESLRKDLDEGKYKNIPLNSLDDELKNGYIKQVDPSKDATPAFMKKEVPNLRRKCILGLKRIGSYLNLLWNPPTLRAYSRDISRMELIINGVQWRLHLAQLKREYNELAQKPLDLSREYIYMPLQFQPEASTSPMGDVFVDQLIIVKILSYCIPTGWQIYVKEHTDAQWRAGAKTRLVRPRGYYRLIAELPNVRIVSPDLSTYNLISSAKAVATCTGTVGWEAVCRGTPALVFGYPWYMDCPGIFRVQDVDSCKKNLSSIAERRVTIDQQEIIDFLYTLEKNSINGAFYRDKLAGTMVTAEESRLALSNAIFTKLESLQTTTKTLEIF